MCMCMYVYVYVYVCSVCECSVCDVCSVCIQCIVVQFDTRRYQFERLSPCVLSVSPYLLV